MGTGFAALDVYGALREQYVEAAHARLDADDAMATARDAWVDHVERAQGTVFADLTLEERSVAPEADAADHVFVDSCYLDFLVDCLLDAVEEETGVSLANRASGGETGAFPVALGPLHDDVLAPEDGRDRILAAVDSPSTVGPATLRELYHTVVPRAARLALGEYHTPRGVADLAVEKAGIDDPTTTVLDPGCGSGVFLTSCLDRKLAATADRSPRERVACATETVAGIDLNPVAVKTAKLAYVATLADTLTMSDLSSVAVPVYLTDALGITRDDDLPVGSPDGFDTLVGNPPWVPWERLPDRLKDGFRERYVERLGLQPHEGAAARLGHSNDDLSIPYVWVCLHRYLREGGTVSVVLKRDVMRGPAGAVLRRLRVGDRRLSVTHVHDLAAVDPFPEVGANAAVYTFSADSEPSWPIPTTVWEAGDEPVEFGDAASLRATATTTETGLEPIDPADGTTAWVRADAERAALGECAHDIRHGLKDDANAVFGLDREILANIEPDLVYPYIKSRHIEPWGLSGHDLRLVPARAAGEDNEAWLEREYPETYAYLSAHREALTDRSSSWLDSGPFYSVFGLGEYTWAPYKVVWCRLGFKPEFAVVSTRSDPDLGERQVVPGDHYMFIATDHQKTAHFLCALLNAAPYQRTLRDISSQGKASLSKSVVSKLRLPAWPDTDLSRRLAALSMQAHALTDADSLEGIGEDVREYETIPAVEAEIDRLVERALTTEDGF